MKKGWETKGKCPFCKEVTYIEEWNDEPECVNCGRSIREKDLINRKLIKVIKEN